MNKNQVCHEIVHEQKESMLIITNCKHPFRTS